MFFPCSLEGKNGVRRSVPCGDNVVNCVQVVSTAGSQETLPPPVYGRVPGEENRL